MLSFKPAFSCLSFTFIKRLFCSSLLSALGFLGSSIGKESACNVGDPSLSLWSGRYAGEGNSYPLQYSGLENSMDRGDWQATVHGLTKSWTQLSDFHFLFFCHRVVLTMYLKLFIFLLAVSIPASVSSSPALGLMYSAYNLNKQGDNIQT